ncbi:MAG: hypothetical protein ACIAQU_06775 [Phycisphaerales bacterium JB064]
MTQRRGWTVLGILGLAAGASAQAITIDIDEPFLAPGDSTLITLSASYPSGDYAVAGVATELVVNEIVGGLSDLQLLAPMDGPGSSAGTLGAGGISGIVAGQLNFPPAMIFADDSNPIAFYSFVYTYTEPLSGPVLLDIETRTTRFDVYVDRDSARSESRLDGLTEGHARIIVPAPAGVMVLGLGALTLGRRRR